MQILGNLKSGVNSINPCLIAVFFDGTTRQPSFALVQEDSGEVPIIRFGQTPIEAYGLLDDCVVSTQTAQGGGLIRRECSLSISTKHTKGYPYFQGPLGKKFYQGGQDTRQLYIALYAVDRSKINEDCRLGLFLGYYQIHAGTSWQEESGVTVLPLIDAALNDNNIIGATEETIPDLLFLFNPHLTGNIIPKVYGRVPRVLLVNTFPTISAKSNSSSIQGTVQSNYTSGSTSIVLEKFADTSSVLRQIAATSGHQVRVRMKDNEIIVGTLSYNSGTQEVTLNVTTRNTFYAKVKGYTNSAPGEVPGDWNVTDHRFPFSYSLNSTVIIDGKKTIIEPEGYLRASINFFDSGVSIGAKKSTQTVSWQMQGFDNGKKDAIRHKAILPNTGGFPQSVVSADFGSISNVTSVSTSFPFDPHTYMFFKNTYVEMECWINNPATAVAGSGSIGDPWQIIAVEFTAGATEFKAIIRNGFSKFDNTHIYAEGDGRLVKIPTSFISSVVNNTSIQGMSGMAVVTLTAPPLDMDIGAVSNRVYADAMFSAAGNGSRSEKIIYEVLKQESKILQYLVGDNITGAVGYSTNYLPFMGYLATGKDTVTQFLDRALFQLGATFRCVLSSYTMGVTGKTHNTFTVVTVNSVDYKKPTFNVLGPDVALENQAALSIQDLDTRIIPNTSIETTALYFKIDYGAWQDPFFKRISSNVNIAIKPYEKLVEYSFDMLQDADSVKSAVGACLSIGHPSEYATCGRIVETKCTMYGAAFEALDPIVFKEFPLLSTADETNAVLDTDKVPMYQVLGFAKNYILSAVGQVDSTKVYFKLNGPCEVIISAKLAQFFTQANGVNIFAPPAPPLEPPVPSDDITGNGGGNPNSPPNSGGGNSGSFPNGGDYDPSQLSISHSPDIEVDRSSGRSSTISVVVSSGAIGKAGGSYILSIVDDGHGISGASLASNTGTIPDNNDQSFAGFNGTHTLTVGAPWFTYDQSVVTSRSVTLLLFRTLKFSPTSDLTYEELTFHTVSCTAKPPTDIDAS